MSNLYIIPARGGSKGIPGKNIKLLGGKPLIYYSLDVAKSVATKDDIICVSTDSEEIISAVESYGIKVDFKRPEYLSTDEAGTNEVILHAFDFYRNKIHEINTIILLQPTSPFRKPIHVVEAMKKFTDDIDMVVSVKETKANPYYLLVEENNMGFLEKSKSGSFKRRQDCPKVYEYNGAVYIINSNSLQLKGMAGFDKVRKYVMDEESSIDLDNPLDWMFAEFFIQHAKKIL